MLKKRFEPIISSNTLSYFQCNSIIFYVAIQCEVPANPENGRAVYASVSYNSLISYECTYGYMLIGDSVRRCERNKEWTGTQPHCKGKLS